MRSEVRPGISGFAVYVPRLAVSLEDFCSWYGHAYAKVGAVVGRGFRQPAAHENVYTMAANAVLRLIAQYDVDPREVGLLALGTESSTDNAAGAVIVRGLVDRALEAKGAPRLPRDVEVPELKHACLGGIYALKSALRYVSLDGRGRKAIVVSADIAEYERGSSGEPTQGAGAVAMLVDAAPTLLSFDLSEAGSASDFRVLDFRKPVARHRAEGYAASTERYADFPVFNGKYSTFCYQDAVLHAVRAMDARSERAQPTFGALASFDALFLHRPYHWMPISGVTWLALDALVRTPEGRALLAPLAERARVGLDAVTRELDGAPDLFAHATEQGIDRDPYPAASALVKELRAEPRFESLVKEKLRLGSDTMRALGNLYTGALPAWLAAGFEEAAREERDLTGARMLALGYGSGDAAEALPFRVEAGWREAASRIDLAGALAHPVLLDREAYEARHDGRPYALSIGTDLAPRAEVVIERVGKTLRGEGQDVGVEYYRYVP